MRKEREREKRERKEREERDPSDKSIAGSEEEYYVTSPAPFRVSLIRESFILSKSCTAYAIRGSLRI